MNNWEFWNLLTNESLLEFLKDEIETVFSIERIWN